MLSLYVFLILNSNCNINEMQKIDFNKAQGLWQYEKMVPNRSGVVTSSGITDQYTFQFTDDLITISLFSDHLTNWKSQDDVYLLQTKWNGHSLFYLPPFGDWTPLADFDGENFFQSDGNSKRIFKKIDKDEVVSWNKAITEEGRLPFLYNLKE
jgi:hypothetical protein